MVILALMLVAFADGARAEIYEWRDASGTRHFTNNKESVPPEQRAALRVVLVEPTVAAPAAAPQPLAEAAQRDEPREAQVVYDELALRRAYAAGVQDGIDLASAPEPAVPASVQINGPLAVANARAADAGYGVPFYEPFVTSSFDRGRSRHLTLRMLLQDQFQLDRDGPFLHERLPTGVGPSFRLFLPRGLAGRVPPGNRVLYR
jgi:hypothetical protein